MKKVFLLSFIFLFGFTLSACTVTEDPLECDQNQEIVDGECVDIDEEPCEDGVLDEDGNCVIEEEPMPESTTVTINGRQFLVNDELFTIQGVCWNPVPKGAQHPQGLDFAGFAELDSNLMKEAGINVVRTYEPITDLEVLDTLYQNGIYVINTVFPYGLNSVESAVAHVNATKDHPAIIMWAIGNEWNYNGIYANLSFTDSVTKLNEVAAAIKVASPDIPITTIYGGVPSKQTIDAMPDVDIWGLNIYAGLFFGTVFNDWPSLSTKPMYMAEYGADAFNANTGAVDLDAQELATRNLTQAILNNNAADDPDNVAIGGTIFEWADEWWKDGSGNPFIQDTGGIAPGGGPYPDETFNEEFWGIVDIDRNPRPAYYVLQELFGADDE